MKLIRPQSTGNFTSDRGEQAPAGVTDSTLSGEGQNLCSVTFNIENLLNEEWSIGGPTLLANAVPSNAAGKK